MAEIKLKGNPVHTKGELPQVGERAPDFTLVDADLNEVSLQDFKGKKKVLNVFVSIDTPTCATSVKKFEKMDGDFVVLNISMDLPFALGRFCGAEGIQESKSLSGFRSSFGSDYGLEIVDGPLKGLFARAVIVLDEENRVLKSELAPEVTEEPSYEVGD